MRQFRASLIGVCASLLLLWPMGVASPAHAKGHAAAAVRCKQRNSASGTLTVSDNFYSSSLSQFQQTQPLAAYPMLFDDLFRWDSRARLFPMMAAQLPTIRNGGIKGGGKTIVIRLKHGLHWSNGSEITSADVKFGWQVGMDPASGPYCSGACDVIHSIATPDRYTAVLHLTRIDPALLSPSVLDAGFMMPLWPHRWAPYWNGDPHTAAADLNQHSIPAAQLFAGWEQGGLLVHGAFQVAFFSENGGPNPDGLAALMGSRYIDRDQQTHNAFLNQNYSGIRNKVIDGAFHQATGTYEPSARRRSFQLIQRELNRRAYWIPLYYPPTISTSDSHIAGFQPSLFSGGEQSWNVYQWRER